METSHRTSNIHTLLNSDETPNAAYNPANPASYTQQAMYLQRQQMSMNNTARHYYPQYSDQYSNVNGYERPAARYEDRGALPPHLNHYHQHGSTSAQLQSPEDGTLAHLGLRDYSSPQSDHMAPTTSSYLQPNITNLQHSERVSTRIKAQESNGTRRTPNYVTPPVDDDSYDTAQSPASSRKRSSSATEGVPKAKKARKNPGSSTSTSGAKRSAVKRESTKNANNTPLTRADIFGSRSPPPSQAKELEGCDFDEQKSRCMSARYKNQEFPRCVACTRRWAGDTCRFQGIRVFTKKHGEDNISGYTFKHMNRGGATHSMRYPTNWNVPLEEEHIQIVRVTAAKALLPVLEEELVHASLRNCLYRQRESEVRATCDCCMTSLFGSGWMCRLCGREACAACYGQMKDAEAGIKTAEECPQFYRSCSKKGDHSAKEFSPVSRFAVTELENAITEMKDLLKNSEKVLGPRVSVPLPSRSPPLFVPQSQAVDLVPAHTIARVHRDDLTEPLFRSLWSKGEPLLVTDLLTQFKLGWTPAFFSEKYGAQGCVVLDCQTEENKKTSVTDFFNMFGKYDNRTTTFKLKDWPPSSDFRNTFPDLYEDFSAAVPVPNYVRRDGVLNIASHFALNTVVPDLGPKMYNAMESSVKAGSKGSTKLHMDMADAVNIMTHAEKMSNGSPGCAAWDLFKAEDSDKIREFLRMKFKPVVIFNDPIHSQNFYLDEDLRKELFETTGVKSFRIFQRPGDAVFIPAGCAHQVANLADCVKVAIDFVSPENVDRCEQLTKEFRAENQSKIWKEDILQLRTTLWFAWASCSEQLRAMRSSTS